MHLIESLAAGVRGAENGTVGIYRRGTALRAAIFDDFEAIDGSASPTADLTLDANGGRIVYVNELVNCIVKDDTGIIVREFVSGVNASAVEVISGAFTGTDYESGEQGLSLPLTLQAVLDLWLTNGGAVDWKTVASGAPATIQGALSSSLLYFNVKSTAYGAVGNGSTNDTSAIQAAITAAAAAGGVVYFPPGTYRIITALIVPDKVSLLGSGPVASAISYDAGAGNAIHFTGSTSWVFLRDISVVPQQATSGAMVFQTTATSFLRLDNVHLGSSAFSSGYCLRSTIAALSVVVCSGCTFETVGATSVLVELNSTGVFVGCRFLPAPSSGAVAGNVTLFGHLLGCTFYTDRITSGVGGSVVRFISVASGGATMVGCKFFTPGQLIYAYAVVGSATEVFEAGNSFGSNPSSWAAIANAVAVTATASAHEGYGASSRQVRRMPINDNTANVAIPADDKGTVEVRRTNNGAQNANFTAPGGAGLLFQLVWNNDHAAVGGLITVVGNVKGLANFTVNANRVSVYTFLSYENLAAGGGAGSFYWGLVSTLANVTV